MTQDTPKIEQRHRDAAAYDPVILAKFWANVDVRGEDECWPWRGSTDPKGYGYFYDGTRTTRAHRIALASKLGRRLAKGECGCHSCDNPPCCNPSHLWPGSTGDNIKDMFAKRRDRNGRKAHCRQGHELSGSNLKIAKSGRRICATCDAVNIAASHERRRVKLSQDETARLAHNASAREWRAKQKDAANA